MKKPPYTKYAVFSITFSGPKSFAQTLKKEFLEVAHSLTAAWKQAAVSLSRKPFGLSRQFFAVCCAHNLYAFGVQIPHLQPEKYFLPGTRPGRKSIPILFAASRQTLRGFFDRLRPFPAGNGLFIFRIRYR